MACFHECSNETQGITEAIILIISEQITVCQVEVAHAVIYKQGVVLICFYDDELWFSVVSQRCTAYVSNVFLLLKSKQAVYLFISDFQIRKKRRQNISYTLNNP